MDYAALRTEIALPAYAGKTDAEIAAMLLVPMQLTGRPFTWGAVRVLAQISGAWGKVVKRAQMTPSGAATDNAIYAAANAVSMTDAQVLDPADNAAWGVFQAGITALQAAGDLTAGDVDAIAALAKGTTTRAAEIGWSLLASIDLASVAYHIATARAWP